ncbi:MAG: hypothetical protein MUO82_02580 [Candidatus Thermoplasmatota archaeon]|nr:hypothetical protein [Candidatus Thermoplasmatota archaeon]
MEHYEYSIMDKMRLKKHSLLKIVKRDFEKPDGIKFIWSIDGNEEIINPKK